MERLNKNLHQSSFIAILCGSLCLLVLDRAITNGFYFFGCEKEKIKRVLQDQEGRVGGGDDAQTNHQKRQRAAEAAENFPTSIDFSPYLLASMPDHLRNFINVNSS